MFFVDYQMHTDPANIQVAERIRKGEAGKLAKIVTVGINGGRSDPPKTATIESRLQHGVWDNDIDLGGSFIVSIRHPRHRRRRVALGPAARGGDGLPRASPDPTRTATPRTFAASFTSTPTA